MTLKITSNGQPYGSHVELDGRNLDGFVTEVSWRHRAGDIPRAEIALGLIELEAAGAVVRVVAPNGKDVRRIEYMDGSVDEFVEQPKGGETKSAAVAGGRVR